MATIGQIIISLPGDHPRRRFQRAQAHRLGLTSRFLEASSPDSLPPSKLERLSAAWARPLRPTEVALTDSHRRAWQAVLEEDAPRLICEDDAYLSETVGEVLTDLAARPGLEFVQLETYNEPKLLSHAAEPLAADPFRLHRLYRDRGGAAAYVLWPAGARRLIASVASSYPPADAALSLAPGLLRHQVAPACAVQLMNLPPELAQGEVAALGVSGISAVPRPRPAPGAEWLRYKLRRLRVSGRLLLNRLPAFGRAEYRLLGFERR